MLGVVEHLALLTAKLGLAGLTVTVRLLLPEFAGFVEATPDGKVSRIVLGETIVDTLFSADKMDASAFADQFVKFYNIPRMDVSDDWKTWAYMRADGVKLSIYTKGKILTLEKATGQKDLKKSFD